MNTNEKVWGPDAAEFKPERWITPGGIPAPSDLPRGWSGIVTFCDGPRNCIGYRLGEFRLWIDIFISVSDGGWTLSLAIFEFKIILATLIRSLEFNETTARVHRKILQTMQPVTDGKGALLPVSLSLAQMH